MPIPPSDVCVCVSVCVCVVSVIVRLSVLSLSVIDWCYRNHLYYYYYQIPLHPQHGKLRNMAFLTNVLKLLGFHDTSTDSSQEGDSVKKKAKKKKS